MATEFVTTERPDDHPLEEVFDIEPGTTMVEYKEALPVEAVKPENYDAKDKEVEDQIQEVYEAAMTQFEAQSAASEKVEGKYKARNGEVAIQALNTALHAVRTRAEVKANKDKLTLKQATSGGPKTLNQNLIVADRNEILNILDGEPE